jgi:hypothetical protein
VRLIYMAMRHPDARVFCRFRAEFSPYLCQMHHLSPLKTTSLMIEREQIEIPSQYHSCALYQRN